MNTPESIYEKALGLIDLFEAKQPLPSRIKQKKGLLSDQEVLDLAEQIETERQLDALGEEYQSEEDEARRNNDVLDDALKAWINP